MYLRFRPRRILFYVFYSTVLIMMWAKSGLLVSSTLPLLVTPQSELVLPPGTAVEGDYSGIYRPQIHFSPPRGFMNDPNGMFLDATGTYHLYYQYNPTSTIAGKSRPGN